MIAERIPQIQELSASEKRLLAMELLEEADREEPRTAEVSPEMIQALEDRFEFNMAHPDEFRSWDEVKARLKRARHA